MISRQKGDDAPSEPEDELQPRDDPTRTDLPDEELLVQPLEGSRLRSCIEALLFATPEPIPRKKLRRILKEVEPRAIDDALIEIEADLAAHGHGFSLVEDASGLRLLSQSEFAPYVGRLRGERRIRLSQAAFETLAVIAYRQPIRRADLESIRGVQCGAVLKNLGEWGLVRIVGRDESLGRPLLYGTTQAFLEQFGLPDLESLPSPEQFRELGGKHDIEVASDPAGEPDPPPA